MDEPSLFTPPPAAGQGVRRLERWPKRGPEWRRPIRFARPARVPRLRDGSRARAHELAYRRVIATEAKTPAEAASKVRPLAPGRPLTTFLETGRYATSSRRRAGCPNRSGSGYPGTGRREALAPAGDELRALRVLCLFPFFDGVEAVPVVVAEAYGGNATGPAGGVDPRAWYLPAGGYLVGRQ